MTADGGWKRRGSHYLFESRWFKLRQDELTLPGGEQLTYTLIEHPGWVMVVPLLDDGRVVMERIYRHTLQGTYLECPSGGCNPGEDPVAGARRELEEETGYRATGWEHLGRFNASAGISDERFDIFLATGLALDGRVDRESTEQMEICAIPLRELYERGLRGELENGPTVLALTLAWQRRAA